MLKNTLAVLGLLSLMLVVGAASWEALSPATQIPQETPKFDKSKLEGQKPYTPTRLEWLAVELNARSSVRLTADNHYMLTFGTLPLEDALWAGQAVPGQHRVRGREHLRPPGHGEALRHLIDADVRSGAAW